MTLELNDPEPVVPLETKVCTKCQTRRPVSDFYFQTRRVRGLLCQACNRGLGCFTDNVDFLKEAIKYLEANR